MHGEHRWRSRPATTSARRPSCSPSSTRSPRPSSPPGKYRKITGNEAVAIGMIAAAKLAGKELIYCSLPDHARQRHPAQPGDAQELRRDHVPGRGRDRRRSARPSAPASAARSACTGTSGPGIALKAEAIGLAVMTELPLVIIDVQRGGPSTGLPTKTEQADLLQVLYGRNGECPVPVIAACSPADCFNAIIEAFTDRDEVHDAGHPAHRRLHRQRRRAVDGPGRSTSCRRSTINAPDARRTTTAGFMPYKRNDDARPPVGDPRHAGPRAPHRRPREAGRHRQRQLRAGQPRAHGPHCARRRSPASSPPGRTCCGPARRRATC